MKKHKLDARRGEIRRLLTGFVTYKEECIVAATDVLDLTSQGVFSGSLAVRLFGLTEEMHQYRFCTKTSDAQNACVKALYELGHPASLRTAPEAWAILHWPTMRNPYLMTAEFFGKESLLCFYTAKTLFSRRRASRVFAAWEKQIPEGTLTEVKITLTPTVYTAPEEKKEDK